MKNIFYFILFFTNFLHAQIMADVEDDSPDGRTLTQVEFKRAIILYDKYVASEDFIEMKNKIEKLSSIANKNNQLREFVFYEENINDQKIQNWINKNIPKENNGEATKLLSRIVMLNNKINIDNAEIINILKYKASLSQCQEITNPKLRDK
ncbi:hypothetical protein [Flavobacterium anhuiense]|uniref:Uncharacterized protein n=1 Tax=Flavobacterium anhuiense TaxID=459526 RepID=A0ABY0LL69_9FLAO|nr:hypothetical protein [Flavobacterium anhuiense]SCY30141.1 hypothetical protein SAMN02927916_1785 [Flavobacterium anhuiense]